MPRPGSCACAAAELRGIPPKAIPMTFTKPATAGPIARAGTARLAQGQPLDASPATSAAARIQQEFAGEAIQRRKAADAIAPTTNRTLVRGIVRASLRGRSACTVACNTLPAAKSSDLKRLWFNT